ncbi:MAG: methyltransferase domain-containing protein [Deltaproteobacteria bacterium]|nr:methyltransferase domain-containing protein [Deltaproteobacteria bacterium]
MYQQGSTQSYEAHLSILCCPSCQSSLKAQGDNLSCENRDCGKTFPIIQGRPVLISEEGSLSSIDDFMHLPPAALATPQHPLWSKAEAFYRKFKSLSSVNLSAEKSFETFAELVMQSSSAPRVLVVGVGTQGKGMHKITSHDSIQLINTDISPSRNALLFSDGHDLPFKEGTIDGVIIQAVLEHVLDPLQCVREIHRVLKKTGIVYSEIPFMQQGHSGRHDFTRFTHLGHRRLFRHFEEVDSGVVAGPGTSMAWALEYFVASFAPSRKMMKVASFITRTTGFWLKYFDYLFSNSPAAIDGASCIYFLGRKSDQVLTDKELISQYRGTQDSCYTPSR